MVMSIGLKDLDDLSPNLGAGAADFAVGLPSSALTEDSSFSCLYEINITHDVVRLK